MVLIELKCGTQKYPLVHSFLKDKYRFSSSRDMSRDHLTENRKQWEK